MMPAVPPRQATVKTQRKNLSRTIAMNFQSSTSCSNHDAWGGEIRKNGIGLVTLYSDVYIILVIKNIMAAVNFAEKISFFPRQLKNTQVSSSPCSPRCCEQNTEKTRDLPLLVVFRTGRLAQKRPSLLQMHVGGGGGRQIFRHRNSNHYCRHNKAYQAKKGGGGENFLWQTNVLGFFHYHAICLMAEKADAFRFYVDWDHSRRGCASYRRH